jgi:hypothetical protein
VAWQKGQSGNPAGRKQEKPYRDALRMELAEAGGDLAACREIARAHIKLCKNGDMPAIKELADRLDGKVPQAIVGDDEHEPVRMIVRWQRDDDADTSNT